MHQEDEPGVDFPCGNSHAVRVSSCELCTFETIRMDSWSHSRVEDQCFILSVLDMSLKQKTFYSPHTARTFEQGAPN
jgi:hypothetical protein